MRKFSVQRKNDFFAKEGNNNDHNHTQLNAQHIFVLKRPFLDCIFSSNDIEVRHDIGFFLYRLGHFLSVN